MFKPFKQTAKPKQACQSSLTATDNVHPGYNEQFSSLPFPSNLKLDPMTRLDHPTLLMSANTPIRSLLFVCMGNICRSPAGENVMRKLLEEADLSNDVAIDSAGTIGFHTGNPPDPRMSASGRRRGLPMTGSARQVVTEDLDQFDLVLAMDQENLRDLQNLASNDEQRSKIKAFCEFCVEHDDREVPDPYYGGDQGFEHVLDLLEDGCNQILGILQRQQV